MALPACSRSSPGGWQSARGTCPPSELDTRKTVMVSVWPRLSGPKAFQVISRGEKVSLRGTDPETYITEYAFVYEDYLLVVGVVRGSGRVREAHAP